MQAAGGLIGLAIELAAGMQLGHDDFERRLARNLRMVFHGNAASVIGDGEETLGIEMDLDEIGVACDGLVHGVVDDFGKEVVQRLLVGAANIHAGPHAHRFQPFEHADRRGTVIVTGRRHGRWGGGVVTAATAAGFGCTFTFAAADTGAFTGFAVSSFFSVSLFGATGRPEKRSLLSSIMSKVQKACRQNFAKRISMPIGASIAPNVQGVWPNAAHPMPRLCQGFATGGLRCRHGNGKSRSHE